MDHWRSLGASLLGELVSLGLVVGSFAQLLPPVATLLAIAWYVCMLTDHHRASKAEDIIGAAKLKADELLANAVLTAAVLREATKKEPPV